MTMRHILEGAGEVHAFVENERDVVILRVGSGGVRVPPHLLVPLAFALLDECARRMPGPTPEVSAMAEFLASTHPQRQTAPAPSVPFPSSMVPVADHPPGACDCGRCGGGR